MEDKIRSIEALLGKIATCQATAQEYEHDWYTQEVAKLTQEVLDIAARHEDDIKKPQLDAFRARLTNIKYWVSESLNATHARRAGKLTRLCNEDSTTPPAELKTSLQGKIRGIQMLLGDTTMLRATAQIECSSYIQRINNLTLEATAKLQVLARHKEDIGTTEFNNLKTSLTNIIHWKYKTFADLYVQTMEGINRDQELDTNEIRPCSGIHTTEVLQKFQRISAEILI